VGKGYVPFCVVCIDRFVYGMMGLAARELAGKG